MENKIVLGKGTCKKKIHTFVSMQEYTFHYIDEHGNPIHSFTATLPSEVIEYIETLKELMLMQQESIDQLSLYYELLKKAPAQLN